MQVKTIQEHKCFHTPTQENIQHFKKIFHKTHTNLQVAYKIVEHMTHNSYNRTKLM